MTEDDLLALIATSLSHRPQPVAGGFLFCHTPHVAEFAYLGRVYDPVSTERARAWFIEAHDPGNPYRSFVTEVANGLRIANISLYGVIEQIDRSVGPAIGQPISLDHGNLIERPANLPDTDMVIGGIVGWSSRGAYVMGRDGAVRLVHYANGNDVADEWPTLEAMLRAELTRLAELHDPEGRELSTSTDLMHPNGRRWETEIEPGSVGH
jgi:hypothetical protein